GRAELIPQITEHPHVVVAFEERKLYTPVDQFGQFTQKPDVPPGHHRGIFEPEVKNVAHQVKFACIGLNTVEPSDDTLLALLGCGTGVCSQMEIGSEINLITYRHAGKLR